MSGLRTSDNVCYWCDHDRDAHSFGEWCIYHNCDCPGFLSEEAYEALEAKDG